MSYSQCRLWKHTKQLLLQVFSCIYWSLFFSVKWIWINVPWGYAPCSKEVVQNRNQGSLASLNIKLYRKFQNLNFCFKITFPLYIFSLLPLRRNKIRSNKTSFLFVQSLFCVYVLNYHFWFKMFLSLNYKVLLKSEEDGYQHVTCWINIISCVCSKRLNSHFSF